MILDVDLSQATTALWKRLEGARHQVDQAVRDGAKVVARKAEENARLLAARQVSGQDSGRARRLRFYSPVKVAVIGSEAIVMLGAFLVRARVPEVRAIYETTGYGDRLRRKKLTIKRQLFDGPSQRRYAEPRSFRFVDHPWLEKWGEREDRGQQVLRHVVRLSGTPGAQTRLRLVLQPAVEAEGPAVLARVQAAVGSA